MKKYEHLFFDLDHTLWDFETNSTITLENVFKSNQLQDTLGIEFHDFLTSYQLHNARLWNRHHKGLVKQEEIKYKRMWHVLLDFKCTNEPLSHRLADQYLNELPQHKALFDYTFELLDYLKEKTYTLHIITNGFETVQTSKMVNSRILPYFTTITTSQEAGFNKPMKGIFEYALNKAKTTADKSIMLGDNLEADIAGAINFGMDSVYVNHINQPAGAIQPTFTVNHLSQLTRIL